MSYEPLKLPTKRSYEDNSEQDLLPTFEQAYSHKKYFLKLVKGYYKHNLGNSMQYKIKEIVNQDDYLFQLFRETSIRGG